jgi:hypothetical protein
MIDEHADEEQMELMMIRQEDPHCHYMIPPLKYFSQTVQQYLILETCSGTATCSRTS